MNVNLSQQMTLLGLAAMVFYAILLATGTVGTDVMPQFMVRQSSSFPPAA